MGCIVCIRSCITKKEKKGGVFVGFGENGI
jgi:hypothetical protein